MPRKYSYMSQINSKVCPMTGKLRHQKSHGENPQTHSGRNFQTLDLQSEPSLRNRLDGIKDTLKAPPVDPLNPYNRYNRSLRKGK